MDGSWTETTVGEIMTFLYGKGLPEELRNQNGKVPVYGSNGIVGFHDDSITDGPTVIIGRKGSIGSVHYSPIPCWPIDTTFYVTAPDSLQIRYYYFLLKSLDLEHLNTDSAVPGLNRSAAHARRINIPRMQSEQRAIAHILGTLDDKIDLNRRMSATLEAMARALFRAWFIDFEPVRAKQSGRWRRGESLPGLPAALFDLFPDRLVPSVLGEIPEGWNIKALDEIANFLNGLALQNYPPVDHRYLPVIKIAQLRAGHTLRADRASIEIDPSYIVEDGDILFSWSGSLECVVWTGGKGALNQHLFKVSSTKYPKWLIYFGIHLHLDEFRHIASGKATTMGHIQRHHLSMAKLAIPDNQLLEAMTFFIEPLFDSFWKCNLQSRTLSALRDALLPKLISGALRVADAERFLRERGVG